MPTRIKDITTTVSTLTTDEYIPIDGTTNGTRKLSVTDMRDTNGNLRDLPQNYQSAGYTLVALDRGKHLRTNSNVTVPAGVLGTGQAVVIFNDSAGSIAIVAGSGVTLRLAGTTTTGHRTLAPYGLASILCIDGAGSAFVASGSGLV